jgi:hypothetical protein
MSDLQAQSLALDQSRTPGGGNERQSEGSRIPSPIGFVLQKRPFALPNWPGIKRGQVLVPMGIKVNLAACLQNLKSIKYQWMSTDKQITANQQNGKRSHGPRTTQGRETSSKNATTHGLFSKQPVLPGEDTEALEALDQGLRAQLQPERELELALVDRIVGLTWRLRRFATIEAGILNRQYLQILAERSAKEAGRYHRMTPNYLSYQSDEEVDGDEVESADGQAEIGDRVADTEQLESDDGQVENDYGQDEMPGWRVKILDAEKYQQAMAELHRHNQAQQSETCTYGEAFVRDCQKEDAISKLSRYETSMQRNLFRALHELKRLQAERRGEPVPASVEVDIDVNVTNTDKT